MKKITFILTSMLFLLVGGVFSQTPLPIQGYYSNIAFEKSDVDGYAGKVTFYNGAHSNYYSWIGSSYVGGTGWAESYLSGYKHTFTVTLEETGNTDNVDLYIAALPGDITNPYGDETVIAYNHINTSNDKILTLDLTENYGGIFLYKMGDSGNPSIIIKSITRTITPLSSVDKPTITAPATYDGESTAVTITPGANNHHVKYSVSGSSSDVSDVQITSETTIYITGTSDVTITAVGYNEGESESNTNTKTITYSNVVPSGIDNVWESSQSFDNNWSNSITIDKSKFNEINEGDYIFLYADHENDVTAIGLRSDRGGWDAAPWYGFTHDEGYTSGGTGSLGTMSIGETYWWLKVAKKDGTVKADIPNGDHDSDIKLDAPYYLKNFNTIIQGLNFTLKKVQIRKHVNIGEGANTISKSTDMIVNLGRSFVADTWNTVCLPFVPTADQANTLFGNDYKLAEFTGVSGTTMKFTTITIGDFKAGKPYLVLPKEGCATGTTVLFDVNITAKNPTPVPIGDYTFRGTFTTKKFTSTDNTTSRFVAEGNELKTPYENTTLKSLRCYFTVSPAATARSLSFDVDEEGGTTSINTVQGSGVMVNGYYNLNGQRVAQPTKGLYIVNGKKVVIK